LAFTALGTAASFAGATDAHSIGPPAAREEVAAVHPGDDRRSLSRLPTNLGRGLVAVFHVDNLVPLLAGGTAAAAVSFFDQDVRDSIQDLNWSSAAETGAGPVWSSVLVAGMFTAGRLSHHSRFRALVALPETRPKRNEAAPASRCRLQSSR
jgi:hypothetical protein